ncbi:MAG: DUF4468 domain-containing protein [Bacteroidales bacterium]
MTLIKNLSIYFLIYFLVVTSIYAQVDFPKNDDGEISFSEVVQTENELASDVIYDNFKEWISTKSSNFNRSNSEKNFQGAGVWLGTTKSNFQHVDALFKNDMPLKLADKESMKIIGKVVNKYTGGTTRCIRIVYLEYDLIIGIKDGRYKYEIENFSYTHYNQATGKQSQIYGMKDKGDCKSKGDLGELLSCTRCKKDFAEFYSYIQSDIKSFVTDMKAEIDKKSEYDNW